jgi:4-hydroxybenzoate polyprenyltransferase
LISYCMRLAKRILKFILYSNIFLALCATALVWETYLLTSMPISLRLGVIVFFSTFFIYNVDSLLPYKFNQEGGHTPRAAWIQKNRLELIFLSLGSALSVLFLYWTAIFDLNFWFLLHLVVVAGLYSVAIVPEGERYIPLRDIPLLKVFLIAYVWSAVTVQLPLMEAGKDLFAGENLLIFLRRFLFIFALTLVFDIRDLYKDKQSGTLTFPGKWGILKTKQIALGALLLYVLLAPLSMSWTATISLGLAGIGAGLVVWYSHQYRSQYYFLILADGMMLVQFILVWLLS